MVDKYIMVVFKMVVSQNPAVFAYVILVFHRKKIAVKNFSLFHTRP